VGDDDGWHDSAWLIIGTIVLGAAIRLYGLGTKSVWLDEAFSVQLVREPWSQFVETIRSNEVNMAAYYVLLRQWVRLGTDETTVRLLSAILAILTIPVVYALGARLFGRAAGRIAALLFALDTGDVWAAQEARSYALVIFLVAVSSWLLSKAVDDSSTVAGPASRVQSGRVWAEWMLYCLVSAAAVYAHVYAALVVAGQWAALLATRRRAVPWRVLIASAALLAALLSPLALDLLASSHHQLDWIATPGHTPSQDVLRKLIYPTSRLGLATYLALAVIGVVGLRQRARSARRPDDRWPSAVVLCTLFVPMVIPLAVSVTVKPVLDGRFLGVCIPAVAVAAGVALASFAPVWRGVLLAGIVILQVAGLKEYHHRLPNEDWRGATARILDHAQARDDAVFYTPYALVGYHYYRQLRGDTAAGPRPVFPRHAAELDATDTASDLAGALTYASDHAGRMWVTLSHLGGSDSTCAAAIDATLRPAFPNVAEWSFREIRVLLYARAAPSASSIPAEGPSPAALTLVRRACSQG
jgi:mannosyltransferase